MLADFWPILAIFCRFLADISQFEPILAKETPELFDKIKTGEFTLDSPGVCLKFQEIPAKRRGALGESFWRFRMSNSRKRKIGD